MPRLEEGQRRLIRKTTPCTRLWVRGKLRILPPCPPSLPLPSLSVPCDFQSGLERRQDLAYLHRRSAHGGHALLARRGGRRDEEGAGGGQEQEEAEVEEG